MGEESSKAGACRAPILDPHILRRLCEEKRTIAVLQMAELRREIEVCEEGGFPRKAIGLRQASYDLGLQRTEHHL